MTAGGWIMMITAWGLILGLTVWCMAKVLSAGPRPPSEPPVVPTA